MLCRMPVESYHRRIRRMPRLDRIDESFVQGQSLQLPCFNMYRVGQKRNLLIFYRATLCIRGTSHGPVSVRLSVRLSVRHKSEFY